MGRPGVKLNGRTIDKVEIYADEHNKQIDTVVIVMVDGGRFSIEAEGGHLTIGEEVSLG